MSFKTALTQLGLLNVDGISHHYGITSLPESLSRAQLPALLVMPLEKRENEFYRESGLAFEGIAFGNGTKTARFVVTHLLLVAPIGQGEGMRDHLGLLADCIDAYLEALAADITLADSLEEAAEVHIETGIYPYGKGQYYGCAFRHRWRIAIG